MFRRAGVSLRVMITVVAMFSTIHLNAQAGQNPQAAQSNDISRRAKTKVQPVYPDLARKMNITGTVKVEVVVGSNGVVKEARVLGGHPVLASAAVDAARRWRFEPSAADSTGVIDFQFGSH